LVLSLLVRTLYRQLVDLIRAQPVRVPGADWLSSGWSFAAAVVGPSTAACKTISDCADASTICNN
jgi:hypothetical protein